MAAKRFTELTAWQLANRLKVEIYELTSRPAVQRDVEFCDQIRRSSLSVSSNVAEGFGRYGHREFARFLRIAKGSLMETQNHIIDARDRGHLNDREYCALWELSSEALRVLIGLLNYLRGADGPQAPRR